MGMNIMPAIAHYYYEYIRENKMRQVKFISKYQHLKNDVL